jgi:uncharacterized protein (DUF2141 family)
VENCAFHVSLLRYLDAPVYCSSVTFSNQSPNGGRVKFPLAVLLLAAAPASTPNSIRAEISGLRNAKGVVRCLLFRSGDGFPSDATKAIGRAVAAISDGAAVCEFAEPPAGTLAVSFIHDENGNGVLDKNFFGIPTEGYGFSNNARGTMGPAPFDKAAFEHTAGPQVLQLSVVY